MLRTVKRLGGLECVQVCKNVHLPTLEYECDEYDYLLMLIFNLTLPRLGATGPRLYTLLHISKSPCSFGLKFCDFS